MMNARHVAALLFLILSACSVDGTTLEPSRMLSFDLTFPPGVEPETVVDVRLWQATCLEAAMRPLSAADIALARLDVRDVGDRRREASVSEVAHFRCLSLVPVIPVRVGVINPPPERLSRGLDSLWIDIDLPIGYDEASSPYTVVARF